MENLKEQYQDVSDQMLKSLREDKLTRDEKFEWFGYIRAIRDCAFDSGFLSETTIQENLEDAVKLLKD